MHIGPGDAALVTAAWSSPGRDSRPGGLPSQGVPRAACCGWSRVVGRAWRAGTWRRSA